MDDFNETIQNVVRAGVDFLNEVQPNWRGKINLTSSYNILDLRSDVFGVRHIGWLMAEYGASKLISCGLAVPVYNYSDDELMTMIDALSNAWIKEILNGKS